VWESTSVALERLQCDDVCVTQERDWLLECDKDPCYCLTFDVLPMTSAGKVTTELLFHAWEF